MELTIMPYILSYLRMLREKYVTMYEEFIYQLCMDAKAIRILLKGYLPISLLPPSQLQEMLGEVKKALWTTNPDYDIVIKRLHLYYDMKLVTFGIGKDRNLIIQFPFCTAIYPTATDTVSDRNSISSHCR